jgi:hypothetical protein
MSSPSPDDNLTSAEIEKLRHLEVIAREWEQTLQALGGDLASAEIRLTVHARSKSGDPTTEPAPNPFAVGDRVSGQLLPQLRWLLAQSSGTIADAAHQLESRSAEVDDNARAQLREDLLVLDEELATLRALLIGPIDWDAEYGRLLGGELPPFGDDADPDDDE